MPKSSVMRVFMGVPADFLTLSGPS
jgi:hypothetical protein